MPVIRAAFAAQGVTDIVTTRDVSDEQRLALDAISAGFTTIVCAGGDGTCGNAANAILRSGTDTRLGVIPAGTGNDFARTLGFARTDVHEVAKRSVITSNVRMDVGLIDKRFFLNSCGFGFDVAVLQGLARVSWLGNNLVYVYSALSEILGFRGVEMSVQLPGGRHERALYLLAVIANGSRFGGGFAIAPSAKVTDGQLDAVLIRDATASRRLRLLAAAARGKHARFGEVSVERASQFSFTFDDKPYYESDGELHQAKESEISVECIRGALRVLAGDAFGRQGGVESRPPAAS